MSTTPGSFASETLTELLRETNPYLSCDACFEQLDTYVERLFANPIYVDLAMQVHLAACGACAEEAATLMELLPSEMGTVRIQV